MFWEARTITTEQISIPLAIQKKIILISDLHLGDGIWKGSDYLEHIIATTNSTQADMILIAGDFTYYPKTEHLPHLFAAFKKSNKPIYAVLGNHDVGFPGPLFKKELTQALTQNNVHVLENEQVNFSDFSLIGLGELWEGKADTRLVNHLKKPEKTIVLLHNPDVLSAYPLGDKPALTLAGHTHGGQIRIPGLYKTVIPTNDDFDRGYGTYRFFDGTKASYFISQGMGETGVPLRFLCPPTIYVIDLH